MSTLDNGISSRSHCGGAVEGLQPCGIVEQLGRPPGHLGPYAGAYLRLALLIQPLQHRCFELFVVEAATLILIELAQHVVDLVLGLGISKNGHQVILGDLARAVDVKQLEQLLNSDIVDHYGGRDQCRQKLGKLDAVSLLSVHRLENFLRLVRMTPGLYQHLYELLVADLPGAVGVEHQELVLQAPNTICVHVLSGDLGGQDPKGSPLQSVLLGELAHPFKHVGLELVVRPLVDRCNPGVRQRLSTV
mmetsp:Transcript_75913/g.202987  ORF Transcript_75913/g.202987 Transcript_75913/m.202987 type:complete len:247 (+) Transcript_75913:554-1294(+)